MTACPLTTRTRTIPGAVGRSARLSEHLSGLQPGLGLRNVTANHRISTLHLPNGVQRLNGVETHCNEAPRGRRQKRASAASGTTSSVGRPTGPLLSASDPACQHG
jgi:hypothetical protein